MENLRNKSISHSWYLREVHADNANKQSMSTVNNPFVILLHLIKWDIRFQAICVFISHSAVTMKLRRKANKMTALLRENRY